MVINCGIILCTHYLRTYGAYSAPSVPVNNSYIIFTSRYDVHPSSN